MNYLVKVGEGLGFLVKGRESVYVITAASLLPELPPVGSLDIYDRILGKFVGAIDGPQDVDAEILYVDLISGIAVLGFPRGYYQMHTDTKIEELFKQTTLVDVLRPPQPLEGDIGISFFLAHASTRKVRICSQNGTLHIIDPSPTKALIGAPITTKYKGPSAIGVVTNPTSLNDSMARLRGGA